MRGRGVTTANPADESSAPEDKAKRGQNDHFLLNRQTS
jgi:hypothetical protein